MQREEWISVGGGEGQNARVRPAVVRLGDGVELLLSRCVPQHEPDLLAVDPEIPAVAMTSRQPDSDLYVLV